MLALRHPSIAILISGAVLADWVIGCTVAVPDLHSDPPVEDASVDQAEGEETGPESGEDSPQESSKETGPCGPGQKFCPDGCVPNDDPSFGCDDASCSPCDIPNAVAKCSGGRCVVAACLAGTANCDLEGDNGCEADLRNDPLNCSECGRDCGGPCQQSVCQPVQIVSHQASCWDVAVDENHVFWRNGDGGALRAKKDGTEVEVLASEEVGQGALALDDTHAFWVNAGTGEVRRIPKAGGSSELLAATGLEGLRGLVVDDANAYFAAMGQEQGSTGSVGVVSKQGGSPEILAQDLPEPVVMTADDENVYWTSRSNGSVWKVPKVGGSAVVLAPGSSQSSGIVGWGIAVRGANVFFYSSPLVVRVPIAGGPQEELFSGVSSGRFLVQDNGRLLLAASGSDGQVMITPADPVAGVLPRVLASVPAHGIDFDADYVYWTLFTPSPEQKGGVYRVRKPKDY